MFQFDLPKGKSSILKVVGVGGGGGNAVNYMYNQNIEGVDFIICNTDSQALEFSNIPNKIQLGPNLTQGLGAGANPTIGKEATQESIDEIKQILEVNTKMAFITAGMGGGTGTGGAPIVAEICKELGILTVGIVTTPFSYEGLKRKKQANEGIKELKKHVDTLLVISNDKLRHQFGNLTMSQAFSKADNVLATAAKCITDVINSTGQINVDFADVSTVMKSGGVAILGNAACAGEDRAQQAIEEAVNSPLLNDNDISGAKWILININSGQGEYEFTMDEVDTIQTYLLSKAGEGTDIILGLGYDDSLEDKIGITLIATGFDDSETREEKMKKTPAEEKPKKEVLELRMEDKEALKRSKSQPLYLFDQESSTQNKTIEPHGVSDNGDGNASGSQIQESDRAKPHYFGKASQKENEGRFNREPGDEEKMGLREEEVRITLENQKDKEIEKDLMPEISVRRPEREEDLNDILFKNIEEEEISPDPKEGNSVYFELNQEPFDVSDNEEKKEKPYVYIEKAPQPFNYQEIKPDGNEPVEPKEMKPAGRRETGLVERKKEEPLTFRFEDEGGNDEDEDSFEEMRLIEKKTQVVPAENTQETPKGKVLKMGPENGDADDPELERKRTLDRISKLRNLSFNGGSNDSNDEYDKVPAYLRRNVDLRNSIASIENFYKNYTVEPDEEGGIEINTSNSFLDGRNPD